MENACSNCPPINPPTEVMREKMLTIFKRLLDAYKANDAHEASAYDEDRLKYLAEIEKIKARRLAPECQ
jgi:hypothetical protein